MLKDKLLSTRVLVIRLCVWVIFGLEVKLYSNTVCVQVLLDSLAKSDVSFDSVLAAELKPVGVC